MSPVCLYNTRLREYLYSNLLDDIPQLQVVYVTVTIAHFVMVWSGH